MNIEGTRAVVTGAAGGIGEAIAQRLLERGAASVVLTDLDGDRLEMAAERLGGMYPQKVDHLAGDATDDAHLRSVTSGDVDMFFANAGVFRGFGLDAGEDDWAASWDVNVMGHVRAARLLVPRWLERAELDPGAGGCFVSTASAAGLLVQLGSATYTVSKHATLGFAEWLAATYGDRGVQVCCLCPMGVRTHMLEAGDGHEDPNARLGHAAVAAAGGMLSPLEAADVTLDAVVEGRFLALPHPEVHDMQQGKAADRDRWLAGMQRLRRTIESGS
jgi:NAD(P)-dependent dehydrogenase (short-subunit alcohol dehydrogenase family)